MMTPRDLVWHADAILFAQIPAPDVCKRRAVSAAYYALFNALTSSAADASGKDAPEALRHKLRRTFGHNEVKKVCAAYTAVDINTLRAYSFLDRPVSDELTFIAKGFVNLLDQRERADYDLLDELTLSEAASHVRIATQCVDLWDLIKDGIEAQTFLVVLLLMGRRRG